MAIIITQDQLDDTKAVYPPELGWVVDYLGGFLIRVCGNDRTRLAARLTAIGHEYSDNTLYQFLRGKYALPDRGFRGSIQNWIAAATALREVEARRMQSGPMPAVETSTMRLVANFVNGIRRRGRICKWGIISGDTGRQKTFSLIHYAQANNHGHTIYLEAPEVPHLGYFTHELHQRISGAFARTRYERIGHVLKNLNEDKCLIVDNAQRLYNPSTGNRQDCFSLLQRIQDQSGCSIILVMVRDVVTKWDFITEMTSGQSMGFFAQFIGRIGGEENILELPRETPDQDLLLFAQAIGMPADHAETCLPALRHLDRRTGNLRILLQCLQDAAERARIGGRSPTAFDLLEHLPTDKLDNRQRDALQRIVEKARATLKS